MCAEYGKHHEMSSRISRKLRIFITNSLMFENRFQFNLAGHFMKCACGNVLVDNHKDCATFTQRRRGQLKGSLVNISVINSKLKQECKFYVKIKSLLLKSSLNHYHTIRQNLPQPTSNFTKSTQIKRW